MRILPVRLLITLFLVLFIKAMTAQVPDTLTLDFCMQRATEIYPLTKQRKLNEEITTLNNKNSGKNYLPQLDLNAKATYQSDVPTVPVNVPGVTIVPPDKDIFDVHLQVDQLVLVHLKSMSC